MLSETLHGRTPGANGAIGRVEFSSEARLFPAPTVEATQKPGSARLKTKSRITNPRPCTRPDSLHLCNREMSLSEGLIEAR